MADASRPTGAAPTPPRRELERMAFGPGASDEERRLAREQLDRLAPATRAPVPGRPGTPPPVDPLPAPPGEGDADRAAGGDDHPPRVHRTARRAALAGGAILGVLAAAVLIPSALEPSSLDVFQQEQTDRDRDVPRGVANAVAAGATAAGVPGAGADLFASLRRLDAPGATAFAFTDGQVVCLTASGRIECATGEDFRQAGMTIEVDDPGAGGRRFAWGPKGDLRVERDAGILQPRGTDLPQLRRLCMIEHGFDVSTTPRGDLRTGQGVDVRALDYAMARLDCALQYPLNG